MSKREFRPNAKAQSKRVGFFSGPVMSAFGATTNYPSRVESYRPRSPQRANSPPSANTAKSANDSGAQISPRSVSFGNNKREEEKEKRHKYLTARYGQHQMMLIRKRLSVEDWLYESLRDMYNCESDSDDHDCTLDLEDILNLDTDSERMQYAYETLTDAKKPSDIVNAFVKELLQKAKTL
ncbi:protein phosphatase 1 regulatory subunit 14C-like isoform X2 [Mya arenaria]|uniref:protein phosphatase 1 regulatory subunit 14C-like isoform X2 n=1 Tax=Mya arenaria TaxID=6604 RepID=UPI0022E6E386|nr:protein phosphatase 1 regulatory subunit 14C-like isoform X2 [Mya arenaria]